MPVKSRKCMNPAKVEALESRCHLDVTLLNGQPPSAEHVQLAETAMAQIEYQAFMAEDAALGEWRFEFDESANDDAMYDFVDAVNSAHADDIDAGDASYQDWSLAAMSEEAPAGDVQPGYSQNDFEGYLSGSESYYESGDQPVVNDSATPEVVRAAHAAARPADSAVVWIDTNSSVSSSSTPAARQVLFTFSGPSKINLDL